jgi:hypothetical protein
MVAHLWVLFMGDEVKRFPRRSIQQGGLELNTGGNWGS